MQVGNRPVASISCRRLLYSSAARSSAIRASRRGRVEVIRDFRVMGDQQGCSAWWPTPWRTLEEIAGGRERALGRIAAAHQPRSASG